MNEQDRKELRELFVKEYRIKTGKKLSCIEHSTVPAVRSRAVCVDNIVKLSSEYTNIPESDILGKSRKSNIVSVRRMMAVIMREYKVTHVDIGTIIGNKDHTTSIHHVKEHRRIYSVDKDYKLEYQGYKQHIKENVSRLYTEKKSKR